MTGRIRVHRGTVVHGVACGALAGVMSGRLILVSARRVERRSERRHGERNDEQQGDNHAHAPLNAAACREIKRPEHVRTNARRV